MNVKIILLILLAFGIGRSSGDEWLSEDAKEYRVHYRKTDTDSLKGYLLMMSAGVDAVKKFFNEPYKLKFDIYIHPNRDSLDSTWSEDWNEPGFRSECWMVASGVGKRLDLLSPRTWDSLACEHPTSNKEEMQRVITHELFHVIHGQFNISNDFSNTEKIDWFVEGLATYASGQLDKNKLSSVKDAVANSKVPTSLDKFWTGKLRYALSGSTILFIDKTWGRNKLKGLLPFNRKDDLLRSLNITETEFMARWKEFIIKTDL